MRDRIEIVMFIIVISCFGLGYIFFPQREFSEIENRYLGQRPSLTWKGLLDGSYTEQFDAYAADQILGKDMFVISNVAANRCMGVTEINGVFIGRDGYLIQDYQEPDALLEENLEYIRMFAAKHPETEMTLLIAPNASEIYPEKLPAFAETYSQKQVIQQIEGSLSPYMTVVDATETLLEHKDEGVYYKTDHHWNSLGAYYAYRELCEAMGLVPKPLEEYETVTVEEPFYGSLYSKAPVIGQEPDIVELYVNPAGEYQVEYVTEGTGRSAMYAMEYGQRKDKYGIFLGGNYPLTVIRSNGQQEEKVLVIKDSYANCLVPMLADHYSEIHMIDLRYYHEDVGDYLEQEGITKVIFIHNVDFISTDNNFLWI